MDTAFPSLRFARSCNAEFVSFWLQRFRKPDVKQQSHRKMLIDTFVSKIFLYDDKVVIGFNYKDGETTISFDDVRAVVNQGLTGSDLDWSGAPKRKPGKRRVFSYYQGKSRLPTVLFRTVHFLLSFYKQIFYEYATKYDTP